MNRRTKKDYFDNFESSRGSLLQRPASSRVSGDNSLNRTTATPDRSLRTGVRQDLGRGQRSQYRPGQSGASEGYGTILIRARPAGQCPADSPVSLLLTDRRTSGHSRLWRILLILSLLAEDTDRGRTPRRESHQTTRRGPDEVEYHTDKYYTDYFLNSNPKLEEMLTKVDK